jgi:hypothetical protein
VRFALSLDDIEAAAALSYGVSSWSDEVAVATEESKDPYTAQ